MTKTFLWLGNPLKCGVVLLPFPQENRQMSQWTKKNGIIFQKYVISVAYIIYNIFIRWWWRKIGYCSFYFFSLLSVFVPMFKLAKWKFISCEQYTMRALVNMFSLFVYVFLVDKRPQMYFRSSTLACIAHYMYRVNSMLIIYYSSTYSSYTR